MRPIMNRAIKSFVIFSVIPALLFAVVTALDTAIVPNPFNRDEEGSTLMATVCMDSHRVKLYRVNDSGRLCFQAESLHVGRTFFVLLLPTQFSYFLI